LSNNRIERVAEDAHERLDEHEEVHDNFDRRISRNENWRLQAVGALKILGVLIGSGLAAAVVNALVF
jgi:hypothetical protein